MEFPLPDLDEKKESHAFSIELILLDCHDAEGWEPAAAAVSVETSFAALIHRPDHRLGVL